MPPSTTRAPSHAPSHPPDRESHCSAAPNPDDGSVLRQLPNRTRQTGRTGRLDKFGRHGPEYWVVHPIEVRRGIYVAAAHPYRRIGPSIRVAALLRAGLETGAGAGMDRIFQVLIGDPSAVEDAVIKTAALFITAAILFRFTERRTLAEFAPFDWIAAVAAGAIVGRAATASDTSWLSATAALISLVGHARGAGEAALRSADSTIHRPAAESTDPRRSRRPTQSAAMRTHRRRSAGSAATARTPKP